MNKRCKHNWYFRLGGSITKLIPGGMETTNYPAEKFMRCINCKKKKKI